MTPSSDSEEAVFSNKVNIFISEPIIHVGLREMPIVAVEGESMSEL